MVLIWSSPQLFMLADIITFTHILLNKFYVFFSLQDLANDPNFQKAVLRTSHGRRPPPVSSKTLLLLLVNDVFYGFIV